MESITVKAGFRCLQQGFHLRWSDTYSGCRGSRRWRGAVAAPDRWNAGSTFHIRCRDAPVGAGAAKSFEVHFVLLCQLFGVGGRDDSAIGSGCWPRWSRRWWWRSCRCRCRRWRSCCRSCCLYWCWRRLLHVPDALTVRNVGTEQCLTAVHTLRHCSMLHLRLIQTL